MYLKGIIKDAKELEFVIFCIESIASELGADAEQVYKVLTEKSDILKGYIVPEYEILHTQSKEYISWLLYGDCPPGFKTLQAQCGLWTWFLYNSDLCSGCKMVWKVHAPR